MLTAEALREVIDYDPATGIFRWRVSRTNSIRAGDVAGCLNRATGYRYIWIDGKLRKASRLAIQYVTGDWPTKPVDHRNGVKNDDRFENLRIASIAQNAANSPRHRDNKTGFKGVRLHSPGKYAAAICVNGKREHLGLFATPESAHAAYLAAAKLHNGEFARG